MFLGEGNELDTEAFEVWRRSEKQDGVIVYRYDIDADGIGVARLFRTGARREKESGVDGRLEDVGEAAMDLLAGKVYRNEVGAPASGAVRTLMVDGVWEDSEKLKG